MMTMPTPSAKNAIDAGTDTAHAWDAAAEAWDRHAPMLNMWLRAATDRMLDAAGVVPGAQVLDVAAGAGDQTLDIARRVGASGRVLATDISPAILALARAKLQAAGFGAVQTCVADAQALQPAVQAVIQTAMQTETKAHGAGFDAVVCRLGLMFCTAPQRALAGAWQALRPGGRFAALVFSEPQANPCITTLMSTARRHAGLSPASPFDPGTLLSLGRPGLLQQLLTDAGFEQIQTVAVAAPMWLPSVQHYTQFVQTAGLPIRAILQGLPPAAQAAAWRDIEEQLACFNSGDAWVGANELLLCSAARPVRDER